MIEESVDVAVIGGGLAGLAAAAQLTGSGRRVLLLEAGGALGGRARTTEHDGYLLDLGPRALYRGPTRALLARLGLLPHGGVPSLAGSHALHEGALVPGYATVTGLLRTGLLSPRERVAVARLLGLAHGRTRLGALSGLEWLSCRLPTHRAYQAVLALVRVSTYLGRAESVSADAIAAHLATARAGVLYLDGGWQSIVDSLHGYLGSHGVRVRTGARATGIEAGRRVRVRLANGRPVLARSVVLAGLSPRDTATLLDLPALAEQAGEPVHTACLDVALSRLPDPRRTFVYGVDEPVYLSVFSAVARLAPPGGAVIHLAHYDAGADRRLARTRLESLLDTCQPGWRSHLVHQRFLPHMTTVSAAPDPRRGGLRGRPGPDLPGHPGVFLAGDWVGPSGMLADASVASANSAASRVEAHLAA